MEPRSPNSIPRTLTAHGHSCVALDFGEDGAEPFRLLIDPGNLTPSLEGVRADAVLITHAHPDHVDPGQLQALRRSGHVPVYGSSAVAKLLADRGIVDDVKVIGAGELEVGGVRIQVTSTAHEVIYPGVPLPENLAFDIAGSVFVPGDSFALPSNPVDVLLVPTGAPWMKLSETIDYLKQVSPRRIVPVHDGGLGPAHRNMHRTLMTKFAPEGTEVYPLEVGESLELTR